MKKKIKASGSLGDYQERLIESLKDPKEAEAYLNAALEDEDPQVFLMALRNVLEAQCGSLSVISKKTDLNRENLYRMLSKKGNPQLKSMVALLNAAGMQLTISARK